MNLSYYFRNAGLPIGRLEYFGTILLGYIAMIVALIPAIFLLNQNTMLTVLGIAITAAAIIAYFWVSLLAMWRRMNDLLLDTGMKIGALVLYLVGAIFCATSNDTLIALGAVITLGFGLALMFWPGKLAKAAKATTTAMA